MSNDLLDDRASLLCLIESGVALAAALRLFGRRPPGLLIWSDFALNLGISLLFVVFAFTFRCCSYL